MMYRRNIESMPRRPLAKGHVAGLLCAVALLLVAAASVAFHITRGGTLVMSETSLREHGKVTRKRILRSEIPPLNVHTMVYAELFNDTNSTQLEAAVRNGIRHPEQVHDPMCCKDLVPVKSCGLYFVDTMKYSFPCLVPDAKLLLLYIATRFQEVMKEDYPDNPHTYRLVVTSCFRTQSNVDHLRRHNRNASENSSHCYGTTLDISHIRWMDETETLVNELFLKQELAKALYELRYEGLCRVKYEYRQACFHITVNDIEYQGNKPSRLEHYAWEGSRIPKRHTERHSVTVAEDGSTYASANSSENSLAGHREPVIKNSIEL